MSSFLSEIRAQPKVLADRLSRRDDILAAAAAIRKARPSGFLIAARGSSDHAATYAKYLFEMRNRLPVVLAAPSTFTLYSRPARIDRLAVLAISQSGASPDVAAVLEEGARQGCVTVAIVNERDSRTAAAAGHIVEMGAGPEVSVPASKTYSATLACLAMLSAALDPEESFEAALGAIPAAAESALVCGAERLAAQVGGDRLAVVGRGYNLATAQEIALKVAETCEILTEGRSAADFVHGPVAAAVAGVPVILIQAAGPAEDQLQALARDLAGRGARVLRIGDAVQPGADTVLVRSGLPEALTPIPFAIAGQLLASALAERRGFDADHPRGLHKVTETL